MKEKAPKGEKKETRGRPTRYDPNRHPGQVLALARLGKTNQEMAEALNIATSTLKEWVKVHEEFREAFKEGKLEADSKVEASLFTRAIGFEYVERKVITFPNGETRIEETTKKVLPDVTAQIFWLKNRKPHEWRDKIEHSGEDGGPIEILIRRV